METNTLGTAAAAAPPQSAGWLTDSTAVPPRGRTINPPSSIVGDII